MLLLIGYGLAALIVNDGTGRKLRRDLLGRAKEAIDVDLERVADDKEVTDDLRLTLTRRNRKIPLCYLALGHAHTLA